MSPRNHKLARVAALVALGLAIAMVLIVVVGAYLEG